uniref:UbiA-like protein EboC n=2 Tax=Cyanothece sp. BG0011 TaxID=2082950 RepID=UPI001E59A67F|nr:UbiA-like protein EboC [Cyanothece sp. BG0011]
MMQTQAINSPSIWGYLQLMRPANIVTAWADILVGYAAAGGVSLMADVWAGNLTTNELTPLIWLLLATSGLYGGGVVFNDVFDLELDRVERPERPLPRGDVSPRAAILLGSGLLGIGILAAAQVGGVSAVMAIAVAMAALIYDAFGKHHPWFGPLNMGLCRGGNLLLGISVMPMMLSQRWFLVFIPIVYIAAVTAVSQGEVKGGQQSTGWLAIILALLVMAGVLGLGTLDVYHWRYCFPFTLLFAGLVLPPFIQAAQDPSAMTVQKAVKSGVLSLIVLDAAVAAGFAGWLYGLAVLSLLVLSRFLGNLFAIT